MKISLHPNMSSYTPYHTVILSSACAAEHYEFHQCHNSEHMASGGLFKSPVTIILGSGITKTYKIPRLGSSARTAKKSWVSASKNESLAIVSRIIVPLYQVGFWARRFGAIRMMMRRLGWLQWTLTAEWWALSTIPSPGTASPSIRRRLSTNLQTGTHFSVNAV